MKKHIFRLTIALLFICWCDSTLFQPFKPHYYEVGTLKIISNGVEYTPAITRPHFSEYDTEGRLMVGDGYIWPAKEELEALPEIQCADGLEIVVKGKYTSGLWYYTLYNDNHDLVSKEEDLVLPDEPGIYVLEISINWTCQRNSFFCPEYDEHQLLSYWSKIRV